MGFRELKFNSLKELNYLDEVTQLVKNFPTEQDFKLEIIQENEETKVKFPEQSNQKISFKKRFSDLIKQFECENPHCYYTVNVFGRGPKLRNQKHRHCFVLNQEA